MKNNNLNQTPWRLGMVLVAVSCLATACGPDENNDENNDKNNTMMDMGSSNTDMDPGKTDMDPGKTDMEPGKTDMEPVGNDMADMEPVGNDMADMTDMADMADMSQGDNVQEVEPNNDLDTDEATPFVAGDTIAGTIASFDGSADPDLDYFTVTLSAGDVFEWDVKSKGAGFSADGIQTIFQSAGESPLYIERYLGDIDGISKRQAFITEDGDYTLLIFDATLTQDEPVSHGGATATYEVGTKIATLSPKASTVPGSESGDLADGNVDAYSFTWSSDNLLLADVLGSRDPVNSNIDPVTSLWDVAAGTLLEFNDDINADDGEYDSRIVAALENGKEYYLVIDGWTVGAETEYQLDTSESDDSPDAPTLFTAGDTLSGEIASYDGSDDPDLDYFAVDLSAGDVFTWTLDAVGTGFSSEGIFTGLRSPSGATIAIARNLTSLDGITTRQAFIPEDGTYQIIVADISVTSPDGPVNHGGALATYSISTGTAALAPQATTVPGAETGDLLDGDVDTYAFTATTDALFQAQIFAEREPVLSNLDSMIVLWDVTAGAVLVANDDLPSGELDSSVESLIEAGKEYYIIVDGWNLGTGSDYSLSTTLLDDSPNNPTALTLGMSETGEISAADAVSEIYDTDYFTIEMQPGDTVKISVQATGSMIKPRITVLAQSIFGFFALASGASVEGLAAVSFTHPAGLGAEEYYVLVDDEANVPDDENADPAYVGGADYGYTIIANTTTWTPVSQSLPISVMSTYSAPGEYAWYQTPVAAESVIVLSATSTSATPLVSWLNDDGELRESEQLTYLPTVAGDRIFGTRDSLFRGNNGATMFDFDFSVIAYDYSSLSFTGALELAGNNIEGSAQALTLPAEVVAATQQDIEASMMPAVPLTSDYYSVTLVAGQTLIAFTEAEPNATTDADTVLTVRDPNGVELGNNDDLVSDTPSAFSALVVEAPLDGVYIIEVAPFDEDPSYNGGYVLKAFTQQ